jgi:hypothetical protein
MEHQSGPKFKTYERPSSIVPDAPAPSASTARDGTEIARALARQYLPNAVRLLAGVAFSPDSECALHTKYLASKELVGIAGVIPQWTPAPPPPHDESADNNKSSAPDDADDDDGEPS